MGRARENHRRWRTPTWSRSMMFSKTYRRDEARPRVKVCVSLIARATALGLKLQRARRHQRAHPSGPQTAGAHDERHTRLPPTAPAAAALVIRRARRWDEGADLLLEPAARKSSHV